MQNPNADSPLNCDAANLIRLKEAETYKNLGQLYAKQYAINSKQFKKEAQNPSSVANWFCISF